MARTKGTGKKVTRKIPAKSREKSKEPRPYIEVNSKWRGKALGSLLEHTMEVRYSRLLGLVDFLLWIPSNGPKMGRNPFHPYIKTAVTYIPHRHMKAGGLYKSRDPKLKGGSYMRRIIKLRKEYQVSHNRNLLLVQYTDKNDDDDNSNNNNRNSNQSYISSVQEFAVRELGMMVITVKNAQEIAGLISQLVLVMDKLPVRPFMKIRKRSDTIPSVAEVNVMHMLRSLRLGKETCRKLVETFGSIKGIANAQMLQLESTISYEHAETVYDFFHRPANNSF